MARQGEHDPEIEKLADEAARDPAALKGLLTAVGPERMTQQIREASAEALKLVATRRPDALMLHWDELARLLEGENAYSRTASLHVMARLAPADTRGSLADLLDRLYDHLGDKVSVAGHVLLVSPQIARARPELRERITARILDLERLAKPDRLGLLRSYAIEALDGYLEPAERTSEVVAFVSAGLTDDSPKTRKLATEVLRRWGVTR
jgi:hypothetical protein